jgi:type IV secretory pathway TrbF-like protein
MKKILGLLAARTRLLRPVPPVSVPGQVAKDYRAMGRRYFLFGVAGFGYGFYERTNYAAAMARPPQTVVAVLSPQGAVVQTFAADDMTEDEFVTVGKAVAAQFIVRMRAITNPIDFTLAAVDEGRYFLKDVAAIKAQKWLGGRPFDDVVKRRQKRVVLLEQVISNAKPGRGKGGDQILISVQWPETIEANGSVISSTMRGGEVLVERVRNVSPQIAKHNPIGMFVADYNLDTAD